MPEDRIPAGATLQQTAVRFLMGPWLLLVVGIAAFAYANYKFFSVGEQEFCADVEDAQKEARCEANRAEEAFKYGSLGAENDRGIPYPIFYVLPRVFPHCLPVGGVGGYRALGLPWEEGRELPVGFSKKKLGFDRITQNCAICHAASYRMKADDAPTIVAAGPSHTTDTQGFLRFLRCVAKDENFTHKGLWEEMKRNFDLGLDDWLLYQAIIPIARMRFQEQVDGFDWMDQHDFRPGMKRPDWGPGRDDPMNLTKFFLLDPDGSKRRTDQTTGNADFPAIWDLSAREGHSMNWGGETLDPLAVIIDSALGLGAPPRPSFVKQMKDIRAYLQRVKPPPYPLAPAATDPDVIAGRKLYRAHCGDCHEYGGKYFGKVVPIEDIGTDRERFDTWRQEDADGANRVAREMGVERKDMIKDRGYMAGPITGLWLTAPYLHNGSVPNLVELLKPPEERVKAFYRGCDLYDPSRMGFVSDRVEATCANNFAFDTALPGNGNGGHAYGTNLDDAEKRQLIEYLKTL
jgi:mono/diheme cytochrome c family protein